MRDTVIYILLMAALAVWSSLFFNNKCAPSVEMELQSAYAVLLNGGSKEEALKNISSKEARERFLEETKDW